MIKRVSISFCGIIILFIFLFVCQLNTVAGTNDKEVTMVVDNDHKDEMDTEPDIHQLVLEDFSVGSGKNTIELGSLFEHFIENHTEKEEGNDYVGEIYQKNQPYYKVYIHYFEDFNIYTSNLNYDVENRDFDSYIIQQITLKSPLYKTSRDISIGSSLNEVKNVYCEGIESLENGHRTLVYSLGNKSITFMFNQQNIVDSIVLELR